MCRGNVAEISQLCQYPIYFNGNLVNFMEAVWAKDPKDVDEEMYWAFDKFMARVFDIFLDRLHFRADAPPEIKATFSFHCFFLKIF